MTFYEAIVPVCVQMYLDGRIVLDDSFSWGFNYTNLGNLSIEDEARALSGDNNNRPSFMLIIEEALKAAEICKQLEQSPLMKALK